MRGHYPNQHTMSLFRRSPFTPTVLVWAIAFAMFVASAWPGWLSSDSLAMHRDATAGPVLDWYSPVLISIWTALGASSFGPVGPFLIQVTVFWVGILLIALWLRHRDIRWAWLVPPMVYLFESSWALGWLWKDSAITALVVLALGLALWAGVVKSRNAEVALWGGSGVALGLACGITPYMLIALVVALLALIVSLPRGSTLRLRRAFIVGAAGFALAAACVVTYERAVVNPQPTYKAALPLLLDLARIECATSTPAARAKGESVFPKEVLRPHEGSDLCGSFSPYVIDPIFTWPKLPQDTSRVTVPSNSAELALVVRSWAHAALSHPSLLIEARIRQSVKFLISDLGSWWSPSKQLISARGSVAASGSMGDGASIGWPSTGGLPLVITAAVTAVASAVMLDLGSTALGVLSILLLPAAAGVLAAGRSRRRWLRLLPLIGFPLAWTANVALVAPAADFRYVVPAAVWGQLTLLVAIGLRSSRSENCQRLPGTNTDLG